MEVFLMEKKNKLKQRTHIFKVGSDFHGIPFIRFGGNYLSCELGLTHGDRLELIHKGDCIILRKLTATETSVQEVSRLKTTYKRLFNLCERHLEGYARYETVKQWEHNQFFYHLQECGEIVTTLNTELAEIDISTTIERYKKQLIRCTRVTKTQTNPHLTSAELSEYETLLNLLKDCGKHLGIFTRRNLFSFKNKRQVFRMNDHVRHLPHGVNPMMVAENRAMAYNVDDEIANHPEKYNQI